jgi:hypothetical protein
MDVPATVLARLWELGGVEFFEPFFHDITLLCVVAARMGVILCENTGWRTREVVCGVLADESLVWRGEQGKDAHGLWRAPDGELVWWTNCDIGCAWCRVEDVARGTLDRLLASADASLEEEVRRTGYRRWAA